jgi:diaminopimelate epimerase
MRPEPVNIQAVEALPTGHLQFHKMHGAGNDFVLLDWRGPGQSPDRQLDAGLAALLADRRRGIGCDQILILRPASEPACLAAYEIRNSDGSPAGQCGNGARCIALYLWMSGARERQFTLQSPAGRIVVSRHSDGEFELNMGEPRFAADEVPILGTAIHGEYQLDSPFGQLRFGAASMGNPHALLQVENTETAEVAAIGGWLGTHSLFPEGCNIGFAQILDRSSIRLRVFERGAGETLACGSGACAAVAILHRAGKVDDSVRVFLPGGALVIQWAANGQGILMKGPAKHVYSGSISLDLGKGELR